MKANKEENRKTAKSIAIFLLICLPVTWILMGIGLCANDEGQNPKLYNTMINIGTFMPAIAGVLACFIRKEKIGSLMLLPRLRDNGGLYLIAIFGGALLSVMQEPFIMLIFPEVEKLAAGAMPNLFFMLLIVTVTGTVSFIALMGEEIGWMGYLYPKMEKLFGVTISLILMGIIRGLWHIVMIFGMFPDTGEAAKSLIILSASNILLGSVLVYFTKKSGSVIPASIIHSLTNTVPAALSMYLVVDNDMYEKYNTKIQLIGLIPAAIVGVICYVLLLKLKKKECDTL